MAAGGAPSCSRRSFLRACGLGTGISLLAGTSACSGHGTRSTPGAPPSSTDPVIPTARPTIAVQAPTAIREVTSFGAVGDGSTDDTRAILRALEALQPGEALRFPAGRVFCHTKVLVVRTPRTHLLGPGSLRAVDERHSALRIEAANVVVDGLTLAMATTTRRWSTPDQHKLVLGGHDGIVVRDVTIQGSAAAGVFCLGSSNFLLQRVRVSDTRADGIHMTNGSHDGTVEAPVISRSGDDGVAVVSYLDDDKGCRNITVDGPRVVDTTGGRGLSVVGGQNIIYRDIDVTGSFAASVYIACEGGPSVSYPAEGIRVTGGTITGANTAASIDHGAVLVYSGRAGGQVSDVVISGLTISDTRVGASRQIGAVSDNHDALSAIKFENLRLDANPPAYQGNASPTALTIIRVTAAGQPVAVPR